MDEQRGVLAIEAKLKRRCVLCVLAGGFAYHPSESESDSAVGVDKRKEGWSVFPMVLALLVCFVNVALTIYEAACLI